MLAFVTHPVLGFIMGLGLLPCCAFPVVGGLGVALFAFWIWMIVEVVTKEPPQEPNKIVWVLVVILLHWLGALIYYLVRRPERIRTYGS